jgi:hypothetical protein
MKEKNQDSNDEDSAFKNHIDKIKSGLDSTGKIVVESSKKAINASANWTSEIAGKITEKKDQYAEKRKNKKEKFVESLKDDQKYKQIIVDNEKLPPMISIPLKEHDKLVQNIQLLEREVEELKLQIGNSKAEINELETEIVEIPSEVSENEEKGFTGEAKSSINQILFTLAISVLWAVVLIIIDFNLQQNDIVFSGLGSKAVVWPIGTAIWTLFLLSSQSKAGTLLSMGWNNRIKTSMGVGLATTLSLMLTDGEMQAITNVWGWAMTIALCAFLLSGFFRGLYSSVRKISNF